MNTRSDDENTKSTSVAHHRILVIDDEAVILDVIRLFLERTNKYDVKVLAHADDILSQVHHFKPHLIILDILMPRIGGIEVCEMLNEDAVGRQIPIIVLSALDKEADKRNAYKVGVVDYLLKPIDRDELVAKIEKALEFK